ncbi:hypothetical protein AX16_005582 [Volvariella volvacea WC 439]|nr:hypothetical protein AX16_005582 [Volvariella volvacea WC 439]
MQDNTQTVVKSIGVLRVFIQSAHILPWNKFLGGPPDPFVTIALGNGPELATTKYQDHTYDPTWLEAHHIPIQALNGKLNFHLFDHHTHIKHAYLGTGSVDLQSLRHDPMKGGVPVTLSKDGKERGEMLCDLGFYPVRRVASRDDIYAPGIVTVNIRQASNVLAPGDAFPKFIVEGCLEHNRILLFSTHQSTLSHPVWNSTHDFFCTRKDRAEYLNLVVRDLDSSRSSPNASLSVALHDLIEACSQGTNVWPLSGTRNGIIEIDVVWTPLEMD